MKRLIKIIVKLLLVAVIAVVALWNYRILVFDGGVGFADIKSANESTSIEDVIDGTELIASTTAVYYYQQPFDSEHYVIQISAEGLKPVVVTHASKEDLDRFRILGLLDDRYVPQNIWVFPTWAYGLVALLVLLFPTGKRRRKGR